MRAGSFGWAEGNRNVGRSWSIWTLDRSSQSEDAKEPRLLMILNHQLYPQCRTLIKVIIYGSNHDPVRDTEPLWQETFVQFGKSKLMNLSDMAMMLQKCHCSYFGSGHSDIEIHKQNHFLWNIINDSSCGGNCFTMEMYQHSVFKHQVYRHLFLRKMPFAYFISTAVRSCVFYRA